MTLTSTLQATLLRHQQAIDSALHSAFERLAERDDTHNLQEYYGQMRYHLGWVDRHFQAMRSNAGKLMRPTLLLLAYEAVGSWEQTSNPDYLRRALPAAAAVELTHNFTLIHDDIVDGDTERHHRPTLWTVWGMPNGINSGDGMFALSRLALWGVLDEGVEGDIAARLGACLDKACLVVAEGQYLDVSFEGRQDISVSMYIDMIRRKTAELMACSAEMGARLSTRNEEAITRLRSFGEAIGIAFQVRDDLLGIWGSREELGKTEAGDIYRRKQSLPILHARELATPEEQATLTRIYQQAEPLEKEQVDEVLAVLERTGTRDYCRQFLAQQSERAREALASVPAQQAEVATRAMEDMRVLIDFVAAAAQ
ncbi:polyprenyl synthetase [Ktedonobacter sp. SOSP1-52]|uniref:polyprenyl synthetase family protein n=1 Tax=Ktedonobacter sp. SOSP1-52 TaxID=2778366 RepID=UPI001915CCA3|nr:polyprenyl synthetase family protein [Ktedonobacter sp. SOSP1-52]GHO65771.1 polyprenyl synthetase [Ktedonobacter sp. SOSP1-52]